MNANEYKQILDAVRVLPELAPVMNPPLDYVHGTVVRTFCNFNLDHVMLLYGVKRFINPLTREPHMANDMIITMESSPKQWEKVNGDVACARASQGILVVACQREDNHGHVAPIYPASMEMSGSWGKNVPMLSNVGRPNSKGEFNQVWRASQCFKTEPDYYSLVIAQ